MVCDSQKSVVGDKCGDMAFFHFCKFTYYYWKFRYEALATWTPISK
jgi:hypothetical protein